MARLILLLLFPTVLWAAPPSVSALDGAAAARVTDLTVFDAGLSADDSEIRVATVRALGRLQSRAALPRLDTALNDRDFNVRAAAAFAWGQLASAPAASLAVRLAPEVAPPVRVAIVEALGKLDKTDEATLISAADDDADPRVRAAARIGLALLAKREAERIPRFSASTWLAAGESARHAAAYALMRAEKLMSPADFVAAKGCAVDPDSEIRALCVRALGRFGVPALATLTPALTDPDWRVAVEAWRAHAKVGPVGLTKALKALPGTIAANRDQLAGPRLHVWTTALDAALAAPPGNREVAETLWTLPVPNNDTASVALGRAHIRCRAAALLDRTGGDRLADCDPAVPAGLVASLAGTVAASRPPAEWVTRYGDAKTPVMRIALLDAAASMKSAEVVKPAVARALADDDVPTFSQAATTAGALGLLDLTPAMRARYTALAKAKEYEAIVTLFDALATLKDKGAEPLLRGALTYPNTAIAVSASKALEALGIQAVAVPKPGPVNPVIVPKAQSATVRTTKGVFKIRLHSADAPLTVSNFAALAGKGFYDGLTFHRVVPDFVVQGGDPRNDGWGGPGYSIPCEINRHPYVRGAVGMALAGKDTGGSQFFVTHGAQPHLDGRYTVFGQVVSGMDVVDTLAVGDRILGIEFESAVRPSQD